MKPASEVRALKLRVAELEAALHNLCSAAADVAVWAMHPPRSGLPGYGESILRDADLAKLCRLICESTVGGPVTLKAKPWQDRRPPSHLTGVR